jgi:hypothetical protein
MREGYRPRALSATQRSQKPLLKNLKRELANLREAIQEEAQNNEQSESDPVYGVDKVISSKQRQDLTNTFDPYDREYALGTPGYLVISPPAELRTATSGPRFPRVRGCRGGRRGTRSSSPGPRGPGWPGVPSQMEMTTPSSWHPWGSTQPKCCTKRCQPAPSSDPGALHSRGPRVAWG